MNLKDLVVDTKAVWIDFPGISGFRVQLANLSRKELTGLRKRCVSSKFDRKSRQVVETLDEEKFVKEFTSAVVKNWEGLTLEGLESLLLIDMGDKDPKQELAYTADNADILVSQSTEFDTWLNEVVFDLDNFRSRAEAKPAQAPRKAV